MIEILVADQIEVRDAIQWTWDTPLDRGRGVRFTAFFQDRGVNGKDLRQELLLLAP